MKKKGFTLVELIAVMAITSVVLVSVGSLYVTGIKRTQTTKINNDIENEYRNTYQLIKNQMENSDSVVSLKIDNNTKILGKKFNVEKKSNELQGLVEDKAYILTKNNNSNIDTILASFKKGDTDELGLYILYVDKDDIKENNNILNIKNISRVEDVCDNLKTIDISETGNGFNFKLEYLKNRIQRNYEFYISKDSKIININSVPKKLVEFYDDIGSLTVLDPGNNKKSIQLINASISLDKIDNNNPSFFIKDIINKEGKKYSIEDKIEFKNGNIINNNISESKKGFTNVSQFINVINNDTNKGSIANLRNNNGGNQNLQPLNLKFAKADKDVIITENSNDQVNIINDKGENEINLQRIVENLGTGGFVLINKNNEIEINNKIDIKDIKKDKINNFNNYVGAIMNIGDNKCTIIVNGNLTIKSLNQKDLIFRDKKKEQQEDQQKQQKKQPKKQQEDQQNQQQQKKYSIDGMLIYSTGTLNIEGDTSVERTSFVVNNGINITGKLDIKGQYTLTGEKRNVISTFLNNGGN